MTKPIAYAAARIFTGSEMLKHHALVVKEGRIVDIVPSASLQDGLERKDFQNALIAAPAIDLQVYGASGRLLAAQPDAQSLHALNDHCRSHGTAHCMATVATNTYEG